MGGFLLRKAGAALIVVFLGEETANLSLEETAE